MQQTTQPASDTKSGGLPPWVAPMVVILLIVALVFGASKRKEVAQNPLVDILLLTIGVFATAHILRFGFAKLNAPGAVKFLSAPQPTNGGDNSNS